MYIHTSQRCYGAYGFFISNTYFIEYFIQHRDLHIQQTFHLPSTHAQTYDISDKYKPSSTLERIANVTHTTSLYLKGDACFASPNSCMPKTGTTRKAAKNLQRNQSLFTLFNRSFQNGSSYLCHVNLSTAI